MGVVGCGKKEDQLLLLLGMYELVVVLCYGMGLIVTLAFA